MSLSNTVETEMLTDFLARHPTLYLALSTADPGETGAGIAEPVGGSYIRQPVGAVTLSGGSITNNVAVSFPGVTAPWGEVTFVALFTAEEGGTYLGCGAIDTVDCVVGVVVLIQAGTEIVTLD